MGWITLNTVTEIQTARYLYLSGASAMDWTIVSTYITLHAVYSGMEQLAVFTIPACPVKSRSRFNLNILDHIKAKKEGFKGAYIMPPFEGDPQPEPEPQIKTPEKKLVRSLAVCFLW